MQLFTPVNIEPLPRQIDHDSRIISLGSCFAEVMGNGLESNKIQTLVNPFGTVFNPVALGNLLTHCLEKSLPSSAQFLKADGLIYHYGLHSSLFSEASEQELSDALTKLFAEVREYLAQAGFLIVTFGNAFGYYLRATNEVVANCHKQPAREFHKRLLGVEEIVGQWQNILKTLNELNPKLQAVLTVSPVRHTRDTLPLNQVSKAVLRMAVHQLVQNLEQVHYFPAYEIMVDELRDYRFYEPDLIHPNEIAREIIFEKFSEASMNAETRRLMKAWQMANKMLSHRPRNPHSNSYRQHLKKTLGAFDQLSAKMDVENERIETLRRLSTLEN